MGHDFWMRRRAPFGYGGGDFNIQEQWGYDLRRSTHRAGNMVIGQSSFMVGRRALGIFGGLLHEMTDFEGDGMFGNKNRGRDYGYQPVGYAATDGLGRLVRRPSGYVDDNRMAGQPAPVEVLTYGEFCNVVVDRASKESKPVPATDADMMVKYVDYLQEKNPNKAEKQGAEYAALRNEIRNADTKDNKDELLKEIRERFSGSVTQSAPAALNATSRENILALVDKGGWFGIGEGDGRASRSEIRKLAKETGYSVEDIKEALRQEGVQVGGGGQAASFAGNYPKAGRVQNI